ncbi:hypothetical protein Oweho_2544 [Owenweeksia hongkongensis DSM 17368]|uniref:Uncharacterized protein n=1 Tax=Owenweeksia hongkongensis (strain DSM 17368 / CIP 108786 / JCM 12287 / NRRL B-23963 / UST20020801) TaxID=926562 RepID=G8R8B9_OWEHD|nr:hypothetical protein Oweho_2544 [Owenweeksia hongkongensis DSM 17368]
MEDFYLGVVLVSLVVVMYSGMLRLLFQLRVLLKSKETNFFLRIVIATFPYIFIWPSDVEMDEKLFSRGRKYTIATIVSSMVFYLFASLFLG